MEKIISRLQLSFALQDIREQRPDLWFLSIAKNNAVSILTSLRDIHGFTSLILLTAVDYLENNVFQLTYILRNYSMNVSLGIEVKLPREAAVMDSIHHLWQHAETFQRELKEMFGIDFPGSPGIDEGFVLEGWDNIPPLRRDFDTRKYARETFFPRPGRTKHDPRDQMRSKLYSDYSGGEK
ncbi:MAG: NADH-quinone oxidoreductase subunit C [Candidatus Cloacimonetes bacterium]|nr:NADH-quinone oxidoreductase subunit C [Candidatus Cloacimonadota bacterium]